MSTLTALPTRIHVDAVIQAAMPIEAQPFLDALTTPKGYDVPQTLTFGVDDPGQERLQQSFTYGRLGGKPVLVITTGIGLANSASATARALMLVDPDIVIAVGTCGGMSVDINVGDIAGGISTIYNDADATVFGYALGQIPRMPVDYHSSTAAADKLAKLGQYTQHPVKYGRIMSGDSFASAEVTKIIRGRFPDAIATDMETTAMAQVCYVMGVDWVSLRAVSDKGGEDGAEVYHMEGERACRHSFDATVAYLSL